MKRDTPLAEVASHIPPEVAAVLLELHPEIQASVLDAVRESIVNLEERGVDLDPVEYAAVLSEIATGVAVAHNEILRLRVALMTAADWLGKQVNPS